MIQCKIINLRKAIQIENICIAFYINNHGKDIGIYYEVVYLDESTMPKDAKGSTGSAYILDEKNRKVLIPIDVNKIKDTGDLFGTSEQKKKYPMEKMPQKEDKIKRQQKMKQIKKKDQKVQEDQQMIM